MNKVVYNNCYGGFELSPIAVEWLRERGVETDCWADNIPRHYSLLVECVETLGTLANGMCSELKIAEINVNMYRIEEYDGYETVITPEEQYWINI